MTIVTLSIAVQDPLASAVNNVLDNNILSELLEYFPNLTMEVKVKEV